MCASITVSALLRLGHTFSHHEGRKERAYRPPGVQNPTHASLATPVAALAQAPTVISPSANPASGLVGQSLNGACEKYSPTTMFNATVQQTDWQAETDGTGGMVVIAVVNVSNAGNRPGYVSSSILTLHDERGRIFSPADSSVMPSLNADCQTGIAPACTSAKLRRRSQSLARRLR